MMIEAQILYLSCVIGRRGVFNTASSLWPCQKQYLNLYPLIVAFLILGIASITPAWCGEKDVNSTAESSPADAPAPMTDIHDILPPVPAGLDLPWQWIIVIGLGIAALAALAGWVWKRRQKEQTVETIVPELPPEMIARQALDQISDVRGMDGKTFYFRLSAIVRHYVSGRYGVGAAEMTTEEFLPCIDRLKTDSDLTRRLKQLCRSMDPVKFGGAAAMEKQMEMDLMFAREFVRKTTQAFSGDNAKDSEEKAPKDKSQISNNIEIPISKRQPRA